MLGFAYGFRNMVGFARSRDGVKKLKVLIFLAVVLILPCCSSKTTRRFNFNVGWKKVNRLCHSKSVLTVNGRYPGPTITVHEGDDVEVKVTNHVDENTTLHWHGVRQLRTGWADGPSYVTQCPISKGKTYTYRFRVIEQRGTLWWHAHHAWHRASVHGAFIIYPRMPYPFSAPIQAEIPITFGEWWNSDVGAIENEMIVTGNGPNSSDAYTINGFPGPTHPCSSIDTFMQTVERGKTYLLRVINAALNSELFFAVSNHTLTVVEIDAVYTKPFTTKAIMIAPGQTTGLLLTADQSPDGPAFPMAATPYVTSIFPFNNSTTVGFLRYKQAPSKKPGRKSGHKSALQPLPKAFEFDNLPAMQDTPFATEFTAKLKSLATAKYPCNVPRKFDKRVVITVSLNLQDCPKGKVCMGFNGNRYFASMNNQSFIRPNSVSLLESFYKTKMLGKTAGAGELLTTGFAEKPPNEYNFTGVNPLGMNLNTEFGKKIIVFPHGTDVEMILQGTSLLNIENHPIHLHGHNFFVVGKGFGNFDASKDPKKYNLVDPPERNTVGVPTGGWAAIRFKADNPGVWFVHCHLEEHTSWGLATAFVVENGQRADQSLLPPPKDFPMC